MFVCNRAKPLETRLYMKDVETVTLSNSVLSETSEVLRAYGKRGFEGFVLWFGSIENRNAYVERVYVPTQNSIRGEDGVGYFVSNETLFELNKFLSETGLRMIAQVHSHPGRAYHSSTDDRYAIVTAEGGLSLVVPNFASGPVDIKRWAIYRLNQGTWKKMRSGDVRELFYSKTPGVSESKRNDFVARWKTRLKGKSC